LEENVFSKASRAPEHLQFVYEGERFRWQEDESVAAKRLVERKHRIWAMCVAIALTAMVLGQSFGVAWLISAAARASAALP
jgi:hypothetical protein